MKVFLRLHSGGTNTFRPAVFVPTLFALAAILSFVPSAASSEPEAVPWREALRQYEVAYSELGDPQSRRSAALAIASHDRMEGLEQLLGALVFIEDRVEPIRIAYGDLLRRLEPLAQDVLYPQQHEEKAELEKQREALILEIQAEEKTQQLIRNRLAETKNEAILKRLARTGLNHEHWIVRSSAAEVLGEIGFTEAAKHLIKSARDEDARVRTSAVDALAKMRVEETEKTLLRILEKDEAWQVRFAAVQALANLGSKEAVQALIAALGREKGRLIGDIHGKLRVLTGQKLVPKYEAWRDWWEKVKDDYRGRTVLNRAPLPPLLALRDPALPPLSYSGINTFSDRLVFVLDISDSMNDASSTRVLKEGKVTDREAPGRSKLGAAREELKAAIRSLTTRDSFNIVVYNHHVKKWRDKMVQANPSNIALAIQFLNSLEASGGTNIFDALETAFGLGGFGAYDRYYRSSVDTIFLLSDGAPSHGRIRDTNQIRQEIKTMNKLQKIKIHTVSIGHLADGDFLKKLARENKGEHIQRY